MNEWKEATYLYTVNFLEAIQIIDDATTNGFTFKWENNKLYYKEAPEKIQNISEIITKSC